MNKFILLLATIFSLGVVAQAADPSPSPSASAGAPKHHRHHKKATSSPAEKPAASPKASASPKA